MEFINYANSCIYLICLILFVCNYLNRKLKIFELTICTIILSFVFAYDFENIFIESIIYIIGGFFIISFIVKKDLSFFCSTFFFLVYSMVSVFIIYLLQYINIFVMFETNNYFYIFEDLIKISLFLTPIIAGMILWHFKRINVLPLVHIIEEYSLLLGLINIMISFANIVFLWMNNEGIINGYLYFVFIIYITVWFLFFVYFNKFIVFTEKKELDALILAVHKNIEHFLILYEEDEKEIRNIKHDIKNHFTIIKELENKEDINRYICRILPQLEQLNVMKRQLSGNVYLDAIMNSKLEEYSDVELEYEINIEGLKMDYVDLSILVFNLLDNACCAAKDSKGHVYIKINVESPYLFIVVRNDCKKDIDFNARSSKNHGLGLKIIRSIVEKYHGNIQISQEEEEISITIGMTFE